MLIALFTMLILGGGGGDTPMPKDFDKYVKQVVVEKDRQKEILAVTKDMKSVTRAYAKQAKELTNEAYALNRSYSSTGEQLSEVANRYRERRHLLEADLLDRRLKLTDLMTEEEWNAVLQRVDEAKK